MVAKISNDLFTLENVVGVLLAVLIIFDLKIEEPICKLINTPVGITSSIIIAILLFVIMHPVIGILFLIYLYLCVKKNNYSETTKQHILQQLNEPSNTQVEESIILEKAPIKNQNKNNNVSFSPYLVNVGSII